MGLASKLAASQQGASAAAGAGGGQYPGQQQYAAYQGGGAPPPGPRPAQQGGFAPYPGGQGGPGYPPQQQQHPHGQGAPPHQPGQFPPQQQGRPPQGAGAGPRPPQGTSPEVYKQLLEAVVREKGLQNFRWPAPSFLDDLARAATTRCPQFCQKWNVPAEIGNDIVKLGLFDIVFFVDNSGSMRFEENGERIQDLKLILARAASAASLFDTDGISVRFMNWSNPKVPASRLDNIRSEEEVNNLLTPDFPFSGLTPLGTQLRKQVLEPMVWSKLRSKHLPKPVLIIVITDGQPAGEDRATLANVIAETKAMAQSMPQFGQRPVNFQIAQVGNDQAAREFLKEIDDNAMFGDVVDCTSNFENEQVEYANARPPVDLTPELWLMKLLLGAIDDSYDKQDEQTSVPPTGYGGPSGGYGAPPPQNYGPPQGSYQQGYGGAPPGGYGGPPQHQPPQGYQGYPPQQGGYPPQQGGYPPQQGAYPPQQGGPPPQAYNRPPPGPPGGRY